jgi:DNA-binding MarR family transcriptional regulator
MVENDYLAQERSAHDRRSVRVRLTDKGLRLSRQLGDMHDRHVALLGHGVVSVDALKEAMASLKRVERFWLQLVDSGQRPVSYLTNSAA